MTDDLVRSAQRGHLPALKLLYQQHASGVLRQVTGILGSVEDGRDLTQEIFIKAFEKLPELQNVAAFAAWLKQLSSRMAIDQLRRKSDWAQPEILELIEAPDDWVQACDLLTQLDDVEELLRVLSASERALVWLFAVEGYRHDELAALMATSEVAVRQRYRRAIVKLQATLINKVGHETARRL